LSKIRPKDWNLLGEREVDTADHQLDNACVLSVFQKQPFSTSLVIYTGHQQQQLINVQINCSLKRSIKSPLSDAATLQRQFIYLHSIKSSSRKRFTNVFTLFT